MKILRLQSENIKRLTAVDIAFGDGLITIGGKNNAGKSSVLDTVAYALGGQSLIPAEPIRIGETEGMARLDLGELVVTRRFRRDRLTCTCDKGMGAEPPVHDAQCPWWKFGPTSSTLVVTSKDGAKYPTPQAILDRLLGELSFDPLAFSRATARSQNETLRKLAGIDTEKIDEARKMAVALRTDLNRQVKAKETLLAAMAHHKDAPPEEIGADEVNRTLAEAETLRKAANTAASETLVAAQVLRTLDEQRIAFAARCGTLEAELMAVRGSLETTIAKIQNQQPVVDALRATETAAVVAVPDVAAIQTKLRDIEDTNKKVRANVARTAVVADLTRVTEAAKKQDDAVIACDAEKARLLANAVFPIAGLNLTDEGVTFNGLPFEQASTSEQLRTSVAIGLALNPALKVLLIRDGNALDDDSRKLVAEQVAAAGAQVLMEYVTSDAGEVAVMIEDGHVV